MKPRFLILLALVLTGILFIINPFRSSSSENHRTVRPVSVVAYNKISGETNSVPVVVNDFTYMDELLGRDSLLEHPRLKEFKDILLHARNPLDVNDSIDNLQGWF